MIRTIIWYTYFWLFMVFSLLLTLPLVMLNILRLNRAKDTYIKGVVELWAKSLISLAGGKISVVGLEKIPQDSGKCFIANHQGAFDIPIILGYLPDTIGFIAKKELAKLPIVNLWMKAIGCIFINRSDRRGAVKVMSRGVEQIKNGQAMIIFPEGTRSRGPQLNTFKHGSLKLPIRSQAIIIPVSIAGSFKMKEEHRRIHPADVIVTIHDPIDASAYSETETRQLCDKLTKIIEGSV